MEVDILDLFTAPGWQVVEVFTFVGVIYLAITGKRQRSHFYSELHKLYEEHKVHEIDCAERWGEVKTKLGLLDSKK